MNNNQEIDKCVSEQCKECTGACLETQCDTKDQRCGDNCTCVPLKLNDN